MKTVFTKLNPFVLALFLAGCAGRNFVRPAHSELALGKTTSAEIKARFGVPFKKSGLQKNDHEIEALHYVFASGMSWGSLKPVRGQIFYFSEGKLVGYEFSSSFSEDSSDFDGAKVAQIKKNVSTRKDVEQLFGPAGGKFIYPMTPNQNEDAVNYWFNRTKGKPFGFDIYNQMLTVTFNRAGVLTDIVYTQTGEK